LYQCGEKVANLGPKCPTIGTAEIICHFNRGDRGQKRGGSGVRKGGKKDKICQNGQTTCKGKSVKNQEKRGRGMSPTERRLPMKNTSATEGGGINTERGKPMGKKEKTRKQLGPKKRNQINRKRGNEITGGRATAGETAHAGPQKRKNMKEEENIWKGHGSKPKKVGEEVTKKVGVVSERLRGPKKMGRGRKIKNANNGSQSNQEGRQPEKNSRENLAQRTKKGVGEKKRDKRGKKLIVRGGVEKKKTSGEGHPMQVHYGGSKRGKKGLGKKVKTQGGRDRGGDL